MKLSSLFKKIFLGGEVIEKTESPINGEILVIEKLSGERIMRIGGLDQSGREVEKIWRRVLETKSLKLKAKSCLILGLGCGTVADLIAKKWPEAQITGIEIDKEVIEIGKIYFNLGKIRNLSILNEDAIWWITSKLSLMSKQKYDLILVDLYKGQEFPPEAESDEFLEGLKKLLAEDGQIIFNRLNFGEHREKSHEFLEKLKGSFPEVLTQKSEFNLLIFASE